MTEKRTKHDLSANVVKIDYNALLETASIAFRLARDKVHKQLNELYDWNISNTSRSLTANWLADEAKNLAIATETYSTLAEGKTRGVKELINIPKCSDI